METTYRLKIDELNTNFLNKIKKFYDNNEMLEIRIFDKIDETDYLLSSKENRESLFRSIKELKEKNTVSKKVNDLIYD